LKISEVCFELRPMKKLNFDENGKFQIQLDNISKDKEKKFTKPD